MLSFQMIQALILLFLAVVHHSSCTTGPGLQNNDTVSSCGIQIQGLKKRELPKPNRLLHEYQVELDSGFEPDSVFQLKGIIDTKSSISFKVRGYQDERKILLESKHNKTTVTVTYIAMTPKTLEFQHMYGEELTIMIHIHGDQLQICFGQNISCTLSQSDLGPNKLYKLKVSNMILGVASYYTKTDVTAIKKPLKCDVRHCNLTQITKAGTTFVVTRKLPANNPRLFINLGTSHEQMVLHMSLRLKAGATIFNSKLNNKWKSEEKVHLFPFQQGHIYTFSFHVQQNSTMVSVNDLYYKHYEHTRGVDVEDIISQLWFGWEEEFGNYYYVQYVAGTSQHGNYINQGQGKGSINEINNMGSDKNNYIQGRFHGRGPVENNDFDNNI